eukprot:3726041-Amphidinium_carterae.1
MYEDNDACSSVVKSGCSPKLRHLAALDMMNIRAPNENANKCLPGLERLKRHLQGLGKYHSLNRPQSPKHSK